MRICAFIQMYNELSKGNLKRCLDNVIQWADVIVIYDDGSTDGSVEFADTYDSLKPVHIIEGKKNDFYNELKNKQKLLDLALNLNPVPDWIMWIDCDEILDRQATTGGLRRLCDLCHKDVMALSFRELNLWRSHTYARLDTFFDRGWFCRLWRVTPGMHFRVTPGVHKLLIPATIDLRKIHKATQRVIHYGHSNYNECMVKQGFSHCTKEQFQEAAKDSWIFNETKCKCVLVPDDTFPVENIPTEKWLKPKPRTIESLEPYTGEQLELHRQYHSVYKES